MKRTITTAALALSALAAAAQDYGGILRRENRRGGTHPPHRGHSLRYAPRRRGPQPRGGRLLPRLLAAADGRGRRHGRIGRDPRHSLRLDRRGDLPPPGERRIGLLALDQRPPRGRSRGSRDTRRVRRLALHPAGSQRHPPGPAPERDAADQPRDAPARSLREQLPLLPEQTFDPRLRDRPRARLDPQVRRPGGWPSSPRTPSTTTRR